MKKKESEKVTEVYLCDQVKKRLNGIAYKFSSPNRRNVPDRLCILPEGMHFFVEVKSEGKNPSPGQIREIKRLNDMQHPVWLCRTKREVDHVISVVIKTIMERHIPEEPSRIIH